MAHFCRAVKPGGGLRGAAAIPEADLADGLRVVTEDGLHGRISDVRRFRMTAVALWSGEKTRESVTVTARLRLDSGREDATRGPVYPELSPAREVTPDVSFDGRVYLSARDAWNRILGDHRRVGQLVEKAAGARKADMRARLRREQSEASRQLREDLEVFRRWIDQNPKVPVPDLSPAILRLLTLEAASGRTAFEEQELSMLRALPRDTPGR